MAVISDFVKTDKTRNRLDMLKDTTDKQAEGKSYRNPSEMIAY